MAHETNEHRTAPRTVVLGTAGHIDHGKTALVRALTGVDTDRLPAEKARGITIDLGFASLDLGQIQVSLVDVPGHERFIRNMLAGASGLDLAMLVVAADDSVMPQTREHLEILRLLGLTSGLVAITKSDLVDPGWLDLVEEDVRTLVQGTFLEGAPIVRTSSATGEGLGDLRATLERVCAEASPRDDPGLFRMAIDRAFTVAGHGTVVTGTVASGAVAVGDELELLPECRAVRVRGIQRHDRSLERVGRGTRAAINLGGVHHTEIVRGQELALPGYLRPSRIVSIDLRLSADAPRPIRHRKRYHVHLGTAEVSACVALFGTNELGPGESCLGQLHFSRPVVAVHGQPFVVREESPPATLGGGRVLQPHPQRIRRNDRAARDRLASLQSPEPAVRVASALAFQGLDPADELTLGRLTGLSPAGTARAIERLSADGAIVELPLGPRRSLRVVADFAAALEERVLRALARLHESRLRQSSIPRSHVAAALPDLSNALVGGLVSRLEADGRLVGDSRTVALRGHEPNLSQAERRLKSDLAEAIRKGGHSPPDAAELAASAGSRAAVVPELLALLAGEERIVTVGPGLYLDIDVDSGLRRRVAERLADGSSLTMAELRDLLGTTRKFAVPIGEYLDRVGVTRREGDLRRLGEAHAPGA